MSEGSWALEPEPNAPKCANAHCANSASIDNKNGGFHRLCWNCFLVTLPTCECGKKIIGKHKRCFQCHRNRIAAEDAQLEHAVVTSGDTFPREEQL